MVDILYGWPYSLLLAAVAGPLRVALAADGAADVGVRLLGAVRAHRAEGKVELAVLEGGRPAVPAARAALLMVVVLYKITKVDFWIIRLSFYPQT